MTIFNAKTSKGYPTMQFIKSNSVNPEEFEILATVENVQFYSVEKNTVTVWTYPKNKDDTKIIKNVSFTTII